MPLPVDPSHSGALPDRSRGTPESDLTARLAAEVHRARHLALKAFWLSGLVAAVEDDLAETLEQIALRAPYKAERLLAKAKRARDIAQHERRWQKAQVTTLDADETPGAVGASGGLASGES